MLKEKKKKEDCSKKRKPFSADFFWLLFSGLWMAGIFVGSSIQGSGEHYFSIRMLIERKGAHVFEYFFLAYLLWKTFSFEVTDFRRKAFLVFLISFLYAATDEIHQLFVFGREGKISDVGIDGIGILIFISALFAFKKIRK